MIVAVQCELQYSTLIIEIMISNYDECKFLKSVKAWNEKYHSLRRNIWEINFLGDILEAGNWNLEILFTIANESMTLEEVAAVDNLMGFY